MKFYTYGEENKPVILLIPGTCCHHSIFDEVVPLLTEKCFVIVASFSGFDETNPGIYKDMDEAHGFSAVFQSKLISGLMYKWLKNGDFPGWMKKNQ